MIFSAYRYCQCHCFPWNGDSVSQPESGPGLRVAQEHGFEQGTWNTSPRSTTTIRGNSPSSSPHRYLSIWRSRYFEFTGKEVCWLPVTGSVWKWDPKTAATAVLWPPCAGGSDGSPVSVSVVSSPGMVGLILLLNFSPLSSEWCPDSVVKHNVKKLTECELVITRQNGTAFQKVVIRVGGFTWMHTRWQDDRRHAKAPQT